MNENENNASVPKGMEKEGKQGFIPRFMKLDIKKKIQYLAILLVIIVILTIYFSSSGGAGNKKDDKTSQAAAQQTQTTQDFGSIEQQLKYTLSQIQGAGRVEVMIMYESSSEIVPAISVDTQTSTTTDTRDSGSSTTKTENTQSEVVTIGGSGGSSALVLKEKTPQIRGVIVVAEGADNISVKLNLLSAVKTLLNISPDQVDVYKMNE